MVGVMRSTIRMRGSVFDLQAPRAQENYFMLDVPLMLLSLAPLGNPPNSVLSQKSV